MKKILWVFGTSASGKETFIKTVLNNSDLKDQLSLNSKNLAVSKESLRNLGQLDDSRHSIVEEVCELSKDNDVVIVKWQYGDTLLNIPNVLSKMLPSVQHRAIRLIVNDDNQIQRLKTKSWWHDIGHEQNFITRERALVDASIAQLDSTFVVSDLDWSSSKTS